MVPELGPGLVPWLTGSHLASSRGSSSFVVSMQQVTMRELRALFSSFIGDVVDAIRHSILAHHDTVHMWHLVLPCQQDPPSYRHTWLRFLLLLESGEMCCTYVLHTCMCTTSAVAHCSALSIVPCLVTGTAYA